MCLSEMVTLENAEIAKKNGSLFPKLSLIPSKLSYLYPKQHAGTHIQYNYKDVDIDDREF